MNAQAKRGPQQVESCAGAASAANGAASWSEGDGQAAQRVNDAAPVQASQQPTSGLGQGGVRAASPQVSIPYTSSNSAAKALKTGFMK